MTKVIVYSICKNEEKHIMRWYLSCHDADELIIVDTGSTDDTLSIIKSLPITLHQIKISPWRFEDARNASLALCADDAGIMIPLDLDEELTPGWRDVVENAWTSETTRLKYNFKWNEQISFQQDKIHHRHGYRWKNCCHEILQPYGIPEHVTEISDQLIVQNADNTKVRDYIHLLEMDVRENPHNARNSHYLAREYFFQQKYNEAIHEFTRHLTLTDRWAPEASASYRYIAKCYEHLAKTNNNNDTLLKEAQRYYYKSIDEDMASREALIDAAKFAVKQQKWNEVLALTERCHSIPQTTHYLCEAYANKEGPFDLAATAYWSLGQKETARELAQLALDFSPNNQRLIKNLEVMLI